MSLKNKKPISSIFMRVFSYYVVLLILFALVLGLIFINMFDRSNTEHRGAELERVGTNAANMIRKFVLDNDVEGALSYLGVFNEIESGEIWTVSNPNAYRPMDPALESISISAVSEQK